MGFDADGEGKKLIGVVFRFSFEVAGKQREKLASVAGDRSPITKFLWGFC